MRGLHGGLFLQAFSHPSMALIRFLIMPVSSLQRYTYNSGPLLESTLLLSIIEISFPYPDSFESCNYSSLVAGRPFTLFHS